METSLMVNDYPEPNEIPTQEVRAKVTITYIVEGELPSDFEPLAIEEDIRENFNEYSIKSEYIEDVEVI